MGNFKQNIAIIVFVVSLALLAPENRSSQPLASPPRNQQQGLSLLKKGLSLLKIGTTTFQAQWCLRCHNLDLQGGVTAPSLDNVGVRRNSDRMRQKLLAPQEELFVSQMPSYAHLKSREIEGLVVFLSSLTPQRESPDNKGRAKIESPGDHEGRPKFTMGQIERGKKLFSASACGDCHTINGVLQGGHIGPSLTHESQRNRSDEWQLQHLISPVSVYTGGQIPEDVTWAMPAFGKLSHGDLKALVAFLQSLK